MPQAVASSTCSSAFLPSKSNLFCLWQRQIRMAVLSETTFSPSMRYGRLSAGFLGRSLGLSSLNHWSQLLSRQNTCQYCSPRYSRRRRTRQAIPLIGQQPSTSLFIGYDFIIHRSRNSDNHRIVQKYENKMLNVLGLLTSQILRYSFQKNYYLFATIIGKIDTIVLKAFVFSFLRTIRTYLCCFEPG